MFYYAHLRNHCLLLFLENTSITRLLTYGCAPSKEAFLQWNLGKQKSSEVLSLSFLSCNLTFLRSGNERGNYDDLSKKKSERIIQQNRLCIGVG